MSWLYLSNEEHAECLSALHHHPPFENEVWKATNEEENLGQAQMDGLLDSRANMSQPTAAAHSGGLEFARQGVDPGRI